MDYHTLPAWVQQALRQDARWGYFALRARDEVPQAFNYSGTFTDTSDQQSPIILEPDQAIPADMYIQEMGYDVERPNFAPGSVFKAQSDIANAYQPGIKVLLEVGGGFLGDQYNVNIGLSKIQMVIPNIRQLGQANCAWPGKWYMTYSQQLIINCFLTRDLGTTEVPYEVNVVLHAKRIACPGFNLMTAKDAIGRLEDEEGLRGLPKNLVVKPDFSEEQLVHGLGANPHAQLRPYTTLDQWKAAASGAKSRRR